MNESLEERVSRLEREVETLKRELRRTLATRSDAAAVHHPPSEPGVLVVRPSYPITWFQSPDHPHGPVF